MQESSRPENIPLGISLIIATALTISLQDVEFKQFSSTLSLWQIFAMRGLFALPALLGLGWARRQLRAVAAGALQPWPVIRGGCL